MIHLLETALVHSQVLLVRGYHGRFRGCTFTTTIHQIIWSGRPTVIILGLTFYICFGWGTLLRLRLNNPQWQVFHTPCLYFTSSFVGYNGVSTLNLTVFMQPLYHLKHTPILFCFSNFSVLYFCMGLGWAVCLLCITSIKMGLQE
jgi:hypothetical protein